MYSASLNMRYAYSYFLIKQTMNVYNTLQLDEKILRLESRNGKKTYEHTIIYSDIYFSTIKP